MGLVGEDGGLIAGHARILAARQLGIAEIPVMVAAGWSETQRRDRTVDAPDADRHAAAEPTLPLRRRVRAPAREAARKIKGRGRRTRALPGRVEDWRAG